MKKGLLCLFLVLCSAVNAQVNPCDLVEDTNNHDFPMVATQDYMLFERQFGDLKLHFFASIEIINEVPTLSLSIVNQSARFLPAKCFTANSKLFIQLENGKIVNLLHVPEDNCGTGIQHDGQYQRVYKAQFLFHKSSFDELKKSPMSLLRIRWGTETEDFIIKSFFQSEINQQTYYPSTYFQTVLKCLE